MSTHKSVTFSLTNRSSKGYGYKNLAVYHRSLLGYFLPSHHAILFLHVKGLLNQILLYWPSQHRKRAWNFILHIIYFLLTFLRQGLAWSAVFEKCFSLWNLSCLNLRDGFDKVTGRWIMHPLLHRRIRHHIEKWMVPQHIHNGTRFLFSLCQCAINGCFILNNQLYCSILEYCNIIGLYYPRATNYCKYHKRFLRVTL